MLLTVKQTAEKLNMSYYGTLHYIHRGIIPAVRVGSRWRVDEDHLEHSLLADTIKELEKREENENVQKQGKNGE